MTNAYGRYNSAFGESPLSVDPQIIAPPPARTGSESSIRDEDGHYNLDNIEGALDQIGDTLAALPAQYVTAATTQNVTAAKRFTVMPEIKGAANSVIVGKALGSGAIAPFEIQHDDTESYLFHLTGGPNMAGNGAFIGMGVDYGGRGLLVVNKATGVGIEVQNTAAVSNAAAYALLGTQSNTTATLVNLSAAVAGAATLLRLTSAVALNSGVKLQEWRDNTGTFGYVDGNTGALTWNKQLLATGTNASIRLDDGVAQPSRITMAAAFAATEIVMHKWSGSAALYYGHRITAESDRLKIKISEGAAAVGSETYNTMIEFKSTAGSGSTGEIGFFGGSTTGKPTVSGSRGGNAALASLLTGLAALGLVTDSSSA